MITTSLEAISRPSPAYAAQNPPLARLIYRQRGSKAAPPPAHHRLDRATVFRDILESLERGHPGTAPGAWRRLPRAVESACNRRSGGLTPGTRAVHGRRKPG